MRNIRGPVWLNKHIKVQNLVRHSIAEIIPTNCLLLPMSLLTLSDLTFFLSLSLPLSLSLSLSLSLYIQISPSYYNSSRRCLNTVGPLFSDILGGKGFGH
eukprot:sb/3478649/